MTFALDVNTTCFNVEIWFYAERIFVEQSTINAKAEFEREIKERAL
jgi:hypothetical protein